MILLSTRASFLIGQDLSGRSIPAKKSLINDILGFPAGDGDHSLTFSTVYLLVQVFTEEQG
jgi:hypothetical protein